MASSQGPRAETEPTSKASEEQGLARREAEPLENYDSLGQTNIGSADIEMPRLKLLQGLSEPVASQKAPMGSYWNSLNEEPYGDEVLVVPIVGFKNRVLLKVGQGLRCRSLDMVHGIGDPGIACEACPLKDWPEDRRKRGDKDVPPGLAGPECRVSHNWLALIVGGTGLDGKPGQREMHQFTEPHWAVVAWTGTSSKAAKKLNGLFVQSMTIRPGAKWWDRTYKIGAENVRGDKGNYYVPTVGLFGPTTQEHKHAAQQLAAFMRGKEIQYDVDREDVDPEAAAAPASAAGTGADTEF